MTDPTAQERALSDLLHETNPIEPYRSEEHRLQQARALIALGVRVDVPTCSMCGEGPESHDPRDVKALLDRDSQ